MVTKGQAAIGAVGTGAMAGFLTWLGYKNGLITLPAGIASIFGVPRRAPSAADTESSKSASEFNNKDNCEAHGFTWWSEKNACVYVQRADPTLDKFSKKWGGDEVVWLLDKPLQVTMMTYIWKLGGIWDPLAAAGLTGSIEVFWRDLEGKWVRAGSSSKVNFGGWSGDQSAVIQNKITGIKWKVYYNYWHDIDEIKASLM